MRVGTNPLKKVPQLQPYKRHRIIIPIFIGADHAYFVQSIETLKLSLRSLFATIDLKQVSVTVINNDSIPEVDEVLLPYVKSKVIDRYIRNQTNRGKPDAVAGEILASYEAFVTLADCDVLFYHGWLLEIEKVFLCTKGVGAVSPFPVPGHPFYENMVTWLDAICRARVRSGKFISDEAMLEFGNSIGKPDHFTQADLNLQYAYANKSANAMIGCGHFVVCLRRSAFCNMKYTPKLTGASNGERDIDAQIDIAGYLRLSTSKYHVYHLGNVIEPWMEGKVMEIEEGCFAPLHNEASFKRALLPTRVFWGKFPASWRRPFSLLFSKVGLFFRNKQVGSRKG